MLNMNYTTTEIADKLELTNKQVHNLTNKMLTLNEHFIFTGEGKRYSEEALEILQSRPKRGSNWVKGMQSPNKRN